MIPIRRILRAWTRRNVDQTIFRRSQSVAQESMDDKDAKHALPNEIRHLRREVYRLRGALPALAARSELDEKLARHQNLVVQGATGSGKSTQLPQYLAEQCGTEGPRRIICTQPRKVAATSLAKRVAEEWAAGNEKFSQVGGAVGYHVGGHRKIQKWTQIVYMTEEILLQQLMREGAGYLTGVYAIILDEAHERTVRLDLLLGWLCDLQSSANLKLRLLVTSATLDKDLFSKYLNNCPVVMIEGRMFPVEDVYAPPPDNMSVQLFAQAKVVDLHKDMAIEDGDILVFLPGQQEVESSRDFVKNLLATSKPCEVFALHGGQEPEDQAPVFQKWPGRRKIIFATNVAETSVTIDGVRIVVDSGVEKQAIFDAKRNLSSLKDRVGGSFEMRPFSTSEHQTNFSSKQVFLTRFDLSFCSNMATVKSNRKSPSPNPQPSSVEGEQVARRQAPASDSIRRMTSRPPIVWSSFFDVKFILIYLNTSSIVILIVHLDTMLCVRILYFFYKEPKHTALFFVSTCFD